MKQEQCPKCGRPYLRARNGDAPAECRSCQTPLRPQATEPKPLPPHAFPIGPKRPAPPVGPVGPARGRGGLMLAKATGLGAVGLLLLLIIVGVVLVVRKPEAGGGVDEPSSSAAQVADSGTTSEPAGGAGSGGQSPGATDSGTSAPPGSMASRWEVSDRFVCAKSVYANSLVGLGEFDDKYLTKLSEDDSLNELKKEISKAYYADALQEVASADLFEKHEELYRSRPIFQIALKPNGPAMKVAVGAWMHAQGSSAKLFELDQRGYRMVSRTDSIALDEGAIVQEHGVVRIPLNLVWNHAELLKIENSTPVNIDLELRFSDGSSKRVSHTFDIQPVAEVEGLHPWGLGFASIVNETHPWIADFMACIQNDAKVKAAGLTLSGGGGDSCDPLMTTFLLWRELVRRGVVYSNLTAASGGAQRVRQFHEVLGGSRATANCVDGSAVLASLAQAQAINSSLVLVPSHCFVLIHTIPLETTCIGYTPEQLRQIRFPDDDEGQPLEQAIEGMLVSEDFFLDQCNPQQVAQFKPFRQDTAFKSFCLAWLRGREVFVHYFKEAHKAGSIVSDLREQWAALPEGAAKDKKAEEYRVAMNELNLSDQLTVVRIGLARRLGIKPIQPPANLGPLPK